ncbi:MAG: ABC transporter substrate-binding protein [Nitrospinaceae bacterium]|nr:ABC transporter substrate-binding protein [Nitrospinaceae bacterium]
MLVGKVMVRLIAFLVAAGLFAFSPSADAAKLRLGVHRSVNGAADVVAHRLGYFKSFGLEYTTKFFKQGKQMRNAVIQNNLDLAGGVGFSPFSLAVSKGGQVVGVAKAGDICEMARILVKPGSKAKSIKDLKGTYFATSKGTSFDFALKMYGLPKLGMSEKDIKWMSLKGAARIQAVVSGTAAAGVGVDPQAEIIERQGKVRTLENFCKYDTVSAMVVSNPRTLKKSPGLYVKYFKGWLKAHELRKSDPKKFAKVYTAGLQEIGWKAKYPVILAVIQRMRVNPFLTKDVRVYLNDMADKQVKIGWIKKHPDFTTTAKINDSTLRKAAAELGLK